MSLLQVTGIYLLTIYGVEGSLNFGVGVLVAEWVVLELSPQGEDEDPEVLRKAVGRAIKNTKDVFVPVSIITRGHSRSVYKLVENYIFVRRTQPDQVYFKLEGSKYVATVLTILERRIRKISTVPESSIEKMRRQLHAETEQGIEVGDEVLIMSGAYSSINGKVIENIPESNSVQVFVKLRSKQALLTLPRSFLKFLSKETEDQQYNSPFLTKLTRIQQWILRAVHPVRAIVPPKRPLELRYHKYLLIESWLHTFRKARRLLVDPPSPMNFFSGTDGEPLMQKYLRVQQMNKFLGRSGFLFYLPRVQLPEVEVLAAKYSDLDTLNTLIARFSQIHNDCDELERSIPDWNPDMANNIIFDGHNLAYRVINALKNLPEQLIDSDGRSTALVFGFLRSLAAFKKRFEKAHLYVVWDGSKQRRVKMYSDYKADRPEHSEDTYAEMLRLQSILPMFGISQVHNPEEETDDIIACLLKNKLAGKRNIIVSTDRDFLQLVTYTDLLLVPKQGSRSETLYDPDKVVAEYGVPPRLMVHLRALSGDTSDNLPGVPRVPRKILAALLTTHGSISGIYESSLAGVTKTQYEKIRDFEKQARLNVELMALLTDLDYQIREAALDFDAAFEALKQCSIQPETLISTFFQSSLGTGFSKTS
jgi:5'-3' exonuclease/transcription antitermination factor NusG